MMNSLGTWVRSIAIATMLVAVMLAPLIIGAEEIPVLKTWLKDTFYHHWLGKGALSIFLFVVVTLALQLWRRPSTLAPIILAEAILVGTSALIMCGFFLLHAFGMV